MIANVERSSSPSRRSTSPSSSAINAIAEATGVSSTSGARTAAAAGAMGCKSSSCRASWGAGLREESSRIDSLIRVSVASDAVLVHRVIVDRVVGQVCFGSARKRGRAQPRGGAGQAVEDRPDRAALDEGLEERAAHLEEAEHVLGPGEGEADGGIGLVGAAQLADHLARGGD